MNNSERSCSPSKHVQAAQQYRESRPSSESRVILVIANQYIKMKKSIKQWARKRKSRRAAGSSQAFLGGQEEEKVEVAGRALKAPLESSRKAGPDYISAEAASSLSKQVEKASSLSKQRDITFYITEMPTEQLAKMKTEQLAPCQPLQDHNSSPSTYSYLDEIGRIYDTSMLCINDYIDMAKCKEDDDYWIYPCTFE